VRDGVLASSFRDPSGFVFSADGTIYRQVNEAYRAEYDRLRESGLYDALARDRLLVEHEEVSADLRVTDAAYKVIRPTRVPFVSYPYEWSFGQLKAAALVTLRVQRAALDRGMSLKDASAYNVQFFGCRPVFVDTLSFETYAEGRPWVAYRQFCQHFLAPLALMSRVDVRLGRLLSSYLDGIPLDLASGLLPRRTRLSVGLLTHVHLHASSQARYADRPVATRAMKVSRLSLVGLLESLRKTVESLSWEPEGTTWAEYYDNTNYGEEAQRAKRDLVAAYLERAAPATVWDLGANTGAYSRIASERGASTVAFDFDPAAVERNFREGAKAGEENLLPLVLDATNPSPAVGWANAERASLAERGPADAVLALALVHHLAIGNNVPLARVASYFATLGRSLVVEFVPKDDSQVRRLLASREDIFGDYTQEGFEAAFAREFEVVDSAPIEGSVRRLYLMRRLEGGRA
jgi:ribosomal protein L11 methylase PrmA